MSLSNDARSHVRFDGLRQRDDDPLPLLRLEQQGLIKAEWGVTDNNRQARYYRLTAAGRRALDKEVESWKKFAAALDAVLRTT